MEAKNLDIRELLEFRPGRVSLQGRRLILHDLHALAQFRRDLIEMLGWDAARRILTRKGFFWGQTDASAVQRMFRWTSPEELLKASAMLLRIQGLAEADLAVDRLDLRLGRVELTVAWRNSSEFEQHESLIGRMAGPVCWALVGYVSGFASHCLGKNVYFVERQCQAEGAGECRLVGRDLESWGPEIEPFLQHFEAADFQKVIERLTREVEAQRAELARQRSELEDRAIVPGLSTRSLRSPAFARTLDLTERVARFDTTVLITGETGSGKEVLARLIHARSARARRPFLAVNCSALPENLLESELFGHCLGAFTGAVRAHRGLFEEAEGGSVFLDEIGDVPLAMQAKLLRVLQDHEVRRVGESHARAVDVRVISATNQDLPRLIAEGRFREDLFYRLNVVQLPVPPLRERREDILPLARHFVQRCAERLKLPHLRLEPGCIDLLLEHPWPGNVRELENTIEHAAVISDGGVITAATLPLGRIRGSVSSGGESTSRSLEELERDHIQRVLVQTAGNRARAARILGIGEATLYRKLKTMEAAPPSAGATHAGRP